MPKKPKKADKFRGWDPPPLQKICQKYGMTCSHTFASAQKPIFVCKTNFMRSHIIPKKPKKSRKLDWDLPHPCRKSV